MMYRHSNLHKSFQENKTVIYDNNPERDCAFSIEASCLPFIKEEQREVSDRTNTSEGSQIPVTIKTESNYWNTYIKTEQESDNEISTEIEHETMIEEIYIKTEKVDIENKMLSFERPLPVSIPEVVLDKCSSPGNDKTKGFLFEKYNESANMISSTSDTTRNLTTAAKVRCKQCRKIIKQASNCMALQDNDAKTSPYFTYMCEACREGKKFKCSTCPFVTINRTSLYRHILNHKDPSEVKMHKCAQCEYSTKYKHHLNGHMLSHKDSSEVRLFKCEVCDYSTKYKCALKKHTILHKLSSEVEIFNCEVCDFNTKYKCALQRHMLHHKDPLEVELFYCKTCGFGTKHKRNLKKHILRYKH